MHYRTSELDACRLARPLTAAGAINKGAVVAPGEPVADGMGASLRSWLPGHRQAGERMVQLPESVVRDAASAMQQLVEFVEELMAARR